MTTDAAKLIRLMSWLSPAFPIGAYSYSHGLEWAVETGAVRDRTTLVDWLDADLRHGAGRADGIFFAETWRSVAAPLFADVLPMSPAQQPPLPSGEGGGEGDDVAAGSEVAETHSPSPGRRLASPALSRQGRRHTVPVSPMREGTGGDRTADPLIAVAELAAAMRATSELALEASQQGIAFLSAVRKAWPHPALDAHAEAVRAAGITPMLPISTGLACAVHEIALETALPLYLHAGAANLINAAVRLVPLGQTDGQMALAAMETAVAQTAAEAFQSGLEDIGSAAFMIDIASMQHETQYTRLFRS
jgi:urease accessory protein UreF